MLSVDALKKEENILFPSLQRITMIARHNGLNLCSEDFLTFLRRRQDIGRNIDTLELCPEWFSFRKAPFDDHIRAKLSGHINVLPLYHISRGLLVQTSFFESPVSKTDVRGVLPFQPTSDDWSEQFDRVSERFDPCACCDDVDFKYDNIWYDSW